MASNGQLDTTQLTQAANGAPGQLLDKATAVAWQNLVNAAASAGIHLAPEPDGGISSCYRSYANQQYAYDQYQHHGGNVAAVPGTSNHGWGTAVDIAITSSIFNWLNANAGKYGWSNTEGQASGENWHWVYVGGGSAVAGYSQDVFNQQTWLNQSRGEKLATDGILGPLTVAAFKRYQQFLQASWGYTGAIDGIWGPATQVAHQKYYDSVQAANAAASPSNPFGIPTAKGLQKVAKLYGYTGAIDDVWGDGSATGFAKFLSTNWGYSGNNVLGPVMWSAIAKWLRAKYNYVGNDVPGPDMRAALSRANDANFAQL